jgi:hypothetical protein
MACGLSSASESNLADSQHPFDSEQPQIGQNHDVEMSNSFGVTALDHHNPGSYLSFSSLPNCLLMCLLNTRTFQRKPYSQ